MAFAALALLWSVAVLAAALLVPVYGSTTLVGENGTGILAVVAVPAGLTVLAWGAMWRKCSHGGRAAEYAAWTCVGLLAAFCLVSILTIGVFVAPAGLLLARAVSVTPSPSAGSAAGA